MATDKWNFTAQKKRKKKSIKSIVDKNGTKIHKKSEIVGCLNTHFSSVGKDMAAAYQNMNTPSLKDPLDYISEKSCHLSQLSKTVLSEITDLIQSLNENKSCGYTKKRPIIISHNKEQQDKKPHL